MRRQRKGLRMSFLTKTCKAEGDIYLIEKAGKRVAAERADAPQEKGTDEE